MIKFNIPKEHISKFEEFVQSSEEFKLNFVNALNSFEGELNFDLVLEHLESKMNVENKRQIRNTLEIQNNLVNAKNSIGVPLNEFLDILKESLIETGVETLKPNNSIIQAFSKTLSKENSFNVKMKLGRLSNEYQKKFVEAEIFQDMRTIFDDSNNILGSIITHNMKIVLNQNGEIQENYISLNESDLQELSDEIKIAQQQVELIKKKLSVGKIVKL
jgi:hypothetical protein